LHALEDNYKAIQAENYSLREYIIHLQSRLIESQGEYPQPPPNVNLTHPHARHDQHMDHMQRHEGAPVAPMGQMGQSQMSQGQISQGQMSQAHQLQASAARTLAAAGLNSGKHHPQDDHGYDHKRFKDNSSVDAAADDLIRSQLTGGANGMPSSMSLQ
jgi:hypothetical protein